MLKDIYQGTEELIGFSSWAFDDGGSYAGTWFLIECFPSLVWC